MPSGSEKDVLRMIAGEGGQTTIGRIIRSMPCYSLHYTRSVVASLGRHDYLDWKAGGRVELTKKGKQSLGISDEEWQAMLTEREEKEIEAIAESLKWKTPMVGSEFTALRKVKELGRASRAALSQEMNISLAKAGLLFQCLIKRGYISGNHRGEYELTPEGQSFLQEA